ncbi:methyltransferase [Embleya sp. AB8]|uniref:methyltransferase n=1 Tax=Embleya sp. AB8 TaxID=3156304 RepID=UPI003C7671E5
MDQSLSQMSFGYIPTAMLRAAAELKVADALAAGPLSAEEVAERTDTDPAALRRLLRALAGLGLLARLDGGRFALTELADPLRADAPDSALDDILLSTTPELWRAWGELSQIVRTGRAARHPDTGLTAFEAALRDAGHAARFRAAKALNSREYTAGVTGAYDFSRLRTLVDLGGDEGTLLAAVLTAAPALRGVLYERADAVQATTAALTRAGVANRCRVVAGDFATAPEAGANAGPPVDAYLFNHVIRDHDDEHARALLRACRAVVSPAARVLLVETVLPAVPSAAESASYGLTDLNNLVYAGGRERTEAEYRELLATAGLTLTAVFDVPTTAAGMPDYHLIEARPGA